MRKLFKKLALVFLVIIFLLPIVVKADNLADRLKGYILLEVESKGEAWYVNPNNLKRYFLGRPDDAFSIMREQGIGITSSDLAKIPVSLDYLSGVDSSGDGLPDAFKVALGLDVNSIDSDGDGYDDYTELLHGYDPLGPGKLNYDLNFAKAQAGRIFLQVEQNGEAWYVSPENNRRYFLGRPHDAFSIMRNLGLGISNSDLSEIVVYQENDQQIADELKSFNWRYNNQDYYLEFAFDPDIFIIYNQNDKLYTYQENEEPADLRQAYYSIFLELDSQDKQTLALLTDLREMASQANLSVDEELEFILAFIQYIPYDFAKATSDLPVANFPFETLYLNKGVCSDTVFLAVLWLREMGYGSAVLDFPDSNHAALGIACPEDISLDNSGFCYVETTNYFPLGVVPASLSAGLAEIIVDLDYDYFSVAELGTMEIRQAQTGQTYYGVADNKLEVAEMAELKESIEELILKLDQDYLEDRQSVVEQYNRLVEEYNNRKQKFYQL